MMQAATQTTADGRRERDKLEFTTRRLAEAALAEIREDLGRSGGEYISSVETLMRRFADILRGKLK